MYSKNAFNCCKCPQRSGEGGCPAWWELSMTSHEDGTTKMVRACAFEHLPNFLTHIHSAANRATESADNVHNEIKKAVEKANGRITHQQG